MCTRTPWRQIRKKSPDITPLILILGSRSGTRPVSRPGLCLQGCGPSKQCRGGSVEPRARLITWQSHDLNFLQCIQFLKRFLQSVWAPCTEVGVADGQKPKLNPSAFNINGFARISLVALDIRRTSDNRPDLNTKRVSHKQWERRASGRQWMLFPVDKSQ